MAGRWRDSLVIEIISLQTPRGRLLAFAGILGVGCLLALGVFSLPNLSIYSWLGIPSPSIGLTRASLHLLQGEVAAAYEQNWLVFPVIAIVAAIMAADIWRLVESKREEDK